MKSGNSSASPNMISPRRLRSLSPGTKDVKLRPKRAKVEKDQDTPKAPKSAESTLKQTNLPNPEPSEQSLQSVPLSQTTPKGAGIRTRLSTGSIQMNGTMTISAAKEKAEMDQIIKQITKNDPVSATKTPPSGVRKRPTAITPNEILPGDHPPPKKRKIGRNDGSGEDNCNDYFCWLCHKEGMLVCCELCPRVYHTRCLGLSAELPQDWVCPECEKIMRAECVDTRSKAMEMLTIEQLCTLLKYALERMKHAGSEPFQKPVDISAVPNYSDYIFHPMDLTTLERNIKKKMYGCTEALLADAKWILHNCIIYNGAHHKLTNSAKMIIKICKHEMNEIELCPDCYLNSCVRKDDEWFSDTCRVPHTLVWAKLKGYPFWPSKALREVDGQVDVRFFGAHDRSWVPVSQCFLLSKNIPTSLQKGKKNNGLDMAIEELNLHVKKLREKFGGFQYAPFRTPYDKSDSYKPITLKPELPSKPNNSLRLSQSKESKTGNSSSFSGSKPNILRKSVAKIRNKYNAMVSLKKLELSPEKGKKIPVVDGKCGVVEANDDEEHVVQVEHDITDKSDESRNKDKIESGVNKGIQQDSSELEKYLTGNVTVEDKATGKGIKKSFVSSNLIEQIENKLKGLVEEPVKEGEVTDKELKNLTDEKSKTVDDSMPPKEHVANADEVSKLISNESSPEKSDSNVNQIIGENKLEGQSLDSVSEVVKENLPQKMVDNAGSDNQLESKQTDVVSKEIDVPKVETSKTETESKDSYRKKLDTMIKSCKEKLGMDNEKVEDIDSVISENDEDDEEDSTDDDENEDTVESDDNSEESESEDTPEESKDNSEMDLANTDVAKLTDLKKVNEQDKNGISLNEKCGKDGENEGKLNDDSSKITLEKHSGAPDSNEQNKEPKSTNMPGDKSELDHQKDKNLPVEISKASDTNTEKSDNSERKSSKVADLTSSVLQESAENSNSLKGKDVSKNEGKGKSMDIDGKTLDPCSGEFIDKICDEDSDTERLVIDLEDGGNDKKSKKIEGKSKMSHIDPIPNVLDIEKELTKPKKVCVEDKIVEIDTAPKRRINTSEPNASTDKDIVPSVKSVEKENSSKVLDKTQSSDLNNRRRKSSSPLNKAQSTESVNKAQSISPINKAQSKELDDKDVELMDIEDDDEVHEDFSSGTMDMESGLPSTLESSLPYKNFAKPPDVDNIDEVPSSSKIAEKFSKKLLEKIQETVDEMCSEVIKEKSDAKSVESMNQKLKQARWNYFAELNELKHNFQLTMFEMKSGWDSEKDQIVKALTTKLQTEKELAIKEAKKKQWCAQCGKEAIFYCCWNTSYCDYPCQQNHWPQHMHTCLQTNKDKTSAVNTTSSVNAGQKGQGSNVTPSSASAPVSATTNVGPLTSVSGANPPAEPDHLRRLQDNLTMALQREEEKRGEGRPGVSPKFNPPMSSPLMQNIRQPGSAPGNMMFNMQQQMQPNMLQQLQRNRFPSQQQMAMQVQQRSNLPVSQQQQQGNPRMMFSQPLIQQTIYPLQVQPQQQIAQQQLGGTILFQNAQPNLMTYGMPPRPY
ncbi:MYND-type zinc finger-containing chromatin reader ZMYND8-like isoform X3 [Ruditapes philippinarum]|nr:MYND-type zinc finger-containing chromatin reader ZMYND8-like isoform X3 [Ruditapes philippinarum]